MGVNFLEESALEMVAETFQVLSVPLRLAILQQLQGGPLSVGEICRKLTTSQPNVSKHLKLLHGSDLVRKRQKGNTVFYEIADPMVYHLCELVCNGLQKKLSKQIQVFAPKPKKISKKAKTLRSVS